LDEAKSIFPEYYVIPFKPQIQSDFDLVKPDLAIIEKNYRYWWVVEIELCTHSLFDHIIPQLKKLKSAQYDLSLVDNFCRELPTLEKSKIVDMLKGKPPEVLLILNKPMEAWVSELRRLNVLCMIIEAFRSERNSLLLRINGEYPKLETQSISLCYLDSILPNLVVLESPGGVDFTTGQEIKITYENCITTWNRVDIHDKVFLAPKTKNPLEKSNRYDLYRNLDNSYSLVKNR